MESQPNSTVATPTSAPAAPSPIPPKAPSPVNPVHNPSTHYPNGLPLSINGLSRGNGNGNGNGINGNGSASPATGPASTGTTTPSAPSPAVATATAAAAAATTASRPVSGPVPRPTLTKTPTPTPTLPPIAAAPLKPMIIYTPSQPPTMATPRRQTLPRQPSSGSAHKVSIVDPPGSYSRGRSHPNSQSSSQGFPSPRREHELENPKFLDDQSRLTHAMQQSVPAAVRRVIRDNWEKCLLGSEFHHAFLLNAVIHHSNGVIIRRSIKDFGAKMVAEAKHEIIAHLTPLDMDELADEILDRVSEHFLDRALERRLRTIEARSLINALARAERLGYENSDIVGDQKSAFNPAPAPFNPAPHPIPPNTAPQPQHMTNLPQPVRAPPPPPLQCSLCWRKFDNVQPYEYHVSKQVCTKEPPNKEGYPFSCKLCGAGFITKVGQQYHSANRVCGNHGTVAATPLPPINAGSPITVSSGNNSPTQAPPLPPPAPMGTQQHYPVPSQHFSTPTHHSKAPAATPQSSDPYSHLNPKTLEKLNEELHQAEATYSVRFKEAEAIQDPAQRQAKLDGLQNSFSTKQSIIRKKYGVRLRNRRTRAEIDNERQRMGWKHNSPGQPDDTPSAKRRRTDDGPSMLSPQVANNNGDSEGNPVHASVGPEVRSNHLAVSDMQAGLGGSSATASTADPTFSKSTSTQESVPSQDQPQEGPQERESAQNSLSSYQKKGYRVSSHHPPSTETTVGGSATQPTESTQHSGSASAPLVVGEEEDSTDTDSDEDIPASLPLPRPSATPSKSIKG